MRDYHRKRLSFLPRHAFYDGLESERDIYEYVNRIVLSGSLDDLTNACLATYVM